MPFVSQKAVELSSRDINAGIKISEDEKLYDRISIASVPAASSNMIVC